MRIAYAGFSTMIIIIHIEKQPYVYLIGQKMHAFFSENYE